MGGRSPEYPTERYLEPFVKTDGPVLGTAEYADFLDYSTQGGASALERMVEKGYVDTKLVGNSRVWWLTEEGKELLEGQ